MASNLIGWGHGSLLPIEFYVLIGCSSPPREEQHVVAD
jgi:hypothetical protein